MSAAVERISAGGQNVATLQVGFIPDYDYLVWVLFFGFFFFPEKKMEVFLFLTINSVYIVGLCSCYLIFIC